MTHLSKVYRAFISFGLARSLAGFIVCSYCLPLPTFAQVAVGYRNPIFVSASTGIEERRAKRQQFTFSLAGDNVQPIDGSLIYDQNTLWQVSDLEQPFSITVSEERPRLDLREADLTMKAVAVQRTERIFSQISGPAADSFQSVFPLGFRQAEDGLSMIMPISVFAP